MEPLAVFLSNLVLFLTLATLVFAVGACVALLLRRRLPRRRAREVALSGEVCLLKRYVPRDGA